MKLSKPRPLALKKRWLASALGLCLAANASFADFSVNNGQLLDGNNNTFVMRGINHAHTWYKSSSQKALADIAATGANTVRIVLANGQRWSRDNGAQVSQLIGWAKANKLITVLEVHDATGWGEDGGAAHPSTAVDYFLSADIKSAIQGQEDYVIINFANEFTGNSTSGQWADIARTAISRLRAGGLNHTLMIDAANWGQDWSNTMLNNARSVFESDPRRNTIFSVHMYEVYNSSSKVQSYMQAFKNNGLHLVVGEFAADHKGMNVDEDSIMWHADNFGFGYLGWSWSGNSSDLVSLDIARNFNGNDLSPWGSRLVNGANGLRASSRIASIFTSNSSSSSTSSVGGSNLALGKLATSSSTDSTGRAASLAFDGNTTTRWSSSYSDNNWVQVDLGNSYNINRVVLRWETAYGRSYKIQVSSNGSSWTDVYTTSSGAGGVESLNLNGTGRYVRMQGVQRATQWGYSLWEMEVYGSPAGSSSSSSSLPPVSSSSSSSVSSIPTGSGRLVSQNGRLKTINGRLVNERGEPFQLRGISSHGLQWFPQFVNSSSFKWLRDDWNANVVRLAMYTKEGGYLDNASVLDKVWQGIDAAIANDLYVIVDWHILSDGNPLTHKEQAKDFFRQVTARYGNNPHILYEIANEPNGSNVDWASVIKPYANEVIPVIRAGAPDAFVLVGTAVWSQRLDQVVQSPLTFNNVAYSIHFYSCSPEHQDPLRAIVRAAAEAKLPIFSTEWGNSEYTGNGSICPEQTNIWLDLLDSYGISWVNWSLSDKSETSAALKPGASGTGGWTSAQLSDSGNYVRNRLRNYGISSSSSSRSSVASTSSSNSSVSSIGSSSSNGGGNSQLSCSVAQTGSWQGGYQLDVTVRNTGAAVSNWTVYLNYAQPAQITNSWNATLTGNGTTQVTASNVSYNGNLGSGASTSFGLTGNSGSGFVVPSCSTQTGSHSSVPMSSSSASSQSSLRSSSSPSSIGSSQSSQPSSASSSSNSSNSSITRLDNPFVDARWYVDPLWSARATADGGSAVANNSTAVWMDRIGAIEPDMVGTMGLREHLDAALNQNANLIKVVIYDLPNRDCHALASNGELKHGPEGSARYRTEYIDKIASIFADPKYAALRIIAIIEPDSLPNLVTNLSDPECQLATDPTHGYVANTRYTLSKFYPLKNVYAYVDIGHSGWLGWQNNFTGAVTLIGDAIKGATGGVNSVAGFVSNTSGYTPLYEPFLDSLANSAFPGSNGSLQVRQAKFYEWNPHFSEVAFVQAWRNAMIANGFPSNIGMLIDTSRNGWGGVNRPTAASTSTVLDTFVDQSRIDRRTHRGNWCNQRGGIGERPKAAPVPGIDAYVWVKPPGESDGAASLELSYDPQDPAKGFDRMCDPTYIYNPGSGTLVTTGALANAPVAGRWFSEGFRVLLQNAYPPLN